MSETRENILHNIKNQGDIVRKLKAEIDDEITCLLAFTAKLREGPSQTALKTPIGTRDYGPEQMTLRQGVLDKIVKVFKKHGGETIDTPVMELKDILADKYGEDAKLIFDLKDQGGELLSLRYDLTVPLARYLAMNKMSSIKRYHIAKVYRRDNPDVTGGRYREFYQCDFDIAGTYDPILPDAEIIKIVAEVMDTLKIGDYIIKLNHRQLLDGIFEACGVTVDKFRSICSSVDRLDKSPWEDVRRETIEKKGLNANTADRIGEYLKYSGGIELVDKLLSDEHLKAYPSAVQGLNEMRLLLKYCYAMGLKEKISFELSLARGHDYYTGLIFECSLKTKPKAVDNIVAAGTIASVAGGGRYDHLVGMFDSKGKQVPCVGVSIGVERIFSILESKHNATKVKLRTTEVEVYVASAENGLHEKRLSILNELWDQGIKAEHSYNLNPQLKEQMQHCEKHQIPLVLILQDSDIKRGVIKLCEVDSRKESKVPLVDLVSEIRTRLRT